MEIGAQLYTVREHTKTLEDFSRTLEKIAAIGYRNVQVSGTCAYEPAWLKAELGQNRPALRPRPHRSRPYCRRDRRGGGGASSVRLRWYSASAACRAGLTRGWPVTRRLRKPTGRWGGGWRPWAAG